MKLKHLQEAQTLARSQSVYLRFEEIYEDGDTWVEIVGPFANKQQAEQFYEDLEKKVQAAATEDKVKLVGRWDELHTFQNVRVVESPIASPNEFTEHMLEIARDY